MTLPDISGLTALPPAVWHALAARLRALSVTPASAAPIVEAASRVAPSLRRPLRLFHLRKLREPLGYAMRLLMFSDAVTSEEAHHALGKLIEPLLDAGLLHRCDDGAISCPFVLSVVDDLYLFSDDLTLGSEAVMGLGGGTVALSGAAFRSRPIARALDLGCGAGACALVLSRCAARVVATDINPRAAALARLNVTFNAIGNVDVREGDLFAPVAGERFDLVASQPPFVPKPESAGEATFQYGGRRGDEVSLRIIAGASAHLAPGGRAVLFIEWPELDDDPIERRIEAATAPSGLDALVLQAPTASPDEHAASYAAAAHPRLDAAFEREVIARCEHLAAAGVRGLAATITVLSRAEGSRPVVETVLIEPMERVLPTGDRIDKLLAARALVRDEHALLAAALRVPEGTVLVQEQIGPGADVPSTLAARFPPAALARQIEMTPDLLGLVTVLHESSSTREGLERFAEAYEVPAERAIVELLPSVKRALLQGVLEVA